MMDRVPLLLVELEGSLAGEGRHKFAHSSLSPKAAAFVFYVDLETAVESMRIHEPSTYEIYVWDIDGFLAIN